MARFAGCDPSRQGARLPIAVEDPQRHADTSATPEFLNVDDFSTLRRIMRNLLVDEVRRILQKQGVATA